MPGLLDRPGDKPSPDENAAINRAEAMTWKAKREYAGVLTALENSRRRCLDYLAALKFGDYAMERQVQDRLLANLVDLKPSIRQMPLAEAEARAEACS